MQSDLPGALALSAVVVWTCLCVPAAATGASLGDAASGAAEASPYGEDRAQAVQCLTEAIYYEAASEPLQGRESVAQVVLNRLRSPAFPKTVCGVVFQGAGGASGCQFTFACDGSMGRRPEPRLWSEARSIAEMVLDGGVPSYVGGATHYHAVYVSPPWRASMIETARIGAHLFYRRPEGAEQRLNVAGESGSVPSPRPRPSAFSPWGLRVATIVPSGAMGAKPESEAAVGRGLGD
ncbi:MAG TPA: cell wall hydrolase [Caulobacteraceae bacterium]